MIAVTTTAAATWVVAPDTYGSRAGSAMATTAGTATALPAVVATAQPAYPGRLPIILSQYTINAPPTNTEIRPKITPGIPPLRTFIRLIPAPRVSPTKGIITEPAGETNSANFLSIFPRIMPTRMGVTVAINAWIGILARPDTPMAIMVMNGPSFNASSAMAPPSTSSP